MYNKNTIPVRKEMYRRFTQGESPLEIADDVNKRI